MVGLSCGWCSALHRRCFVVVSSFFVVFACMSLYPPVPETSSARRVPAWALAVFGVAVVALLVWGLAWIYQDRMERHRHQAELGLQAISHLQTQSLAEWRAQRLTDALSLSDDTLFSQAVAQWLRSPSQDLERMVEERLRILQEHENYTAVHLVDTRGQLLLTPGGSTFGSLPDPEQQALQTALAQAMPSIVEPHRDAAVFAFPYMSLLAPIFDGAQPLGAVWLVVDVRTSLYPLLERWPTASATAESAIVSPDGDTVLFLSPLRHRADTALNLRLPLSHTEEPAVQALLGTRGIFYGRDYRGEPVLAMASAVTGSPWTMVSKIDTREALAAQWLDMLALGLPVLLVLLAAGSTLVLWHRRAWRRERALKTQLQRNLRWLEGAQKAAVLGYFAYDVPTEVFSMSHMANTIFGLPAEGAMGLRQWIGLIHREDRDSTLAVHAHAMSERLPLRTQYRIHRASDGQERWVQVWGEYEVETGGHSVARMIGTVQDITERKEAEQALAQVRAALEERVRLDPLTQVANRLALDEHMDTEWHRAQRSHTPLSLLMIDVDHFKAYNDLYGHVAGDHCLQQVAQAVAGAVTRAGDLVARYGGEEFAVLLPDTDAEHAHLIARKVREAVNALAMPHAHSPTHPHVTVSIGLACTQPGAHDATEPGVQALFEQADAALYTAKQSGRDQVTDWQPLP